MSNSIKTFNSLPSISARLQSTPALDESSLEIEILPPSCFDSALANTASSSLKSFTHSHNRSEDYSFSLEEYPSHESFTLMKDGKRAAVSRSEESAGGMTTNRSLSQYTLQSWKLRGEEEKLESLRRRYLGCES